MGRIVVNVDVVVVVVDRNEWDISNEQQNRRFQVDFGENSRDHGSQMSLARQPSYKQRI
jgi:hypothetical protein